MPKLGKLMTGESGTVLVPVMGFITLMTIAMGGFLGVARNTVNQELAEFHDDRAFFAAESGLILGAKAVLMNYEPGSYASQADIFGQALRGDHAINGMDVTVDVTVVGPTVTVTSTAENASLLNFKKKIGTNMTIVFTSISSGSYGVYLDNAYQFGGNTQGIRKMDWDGPAHFNTALQLGNPGSGNETHFNDRVTLYNIDPLTGYTVSDMTHPVGHYGNDYRYGVEGGSGSWDDEFQGVYDPFAERVATSFDAAGKVDLSLHANDSSLTFGQVSGNPYYQYTDAGGTLRQISIDTSDELKIHIVNKGVAVSGSVKGRITVYTDPGKSMYLPGDLSYADFSTSSFSDTCTSTNSGYGFNSTSVLALYSGADFVVSPGTHYVTAQMFGVNNSSSTLVFEDDKKNKTKFYFFGSLGINGFWDSKQGNDQATFKQKWDRRALPAPGLSLKNLDSYGDTVQTKTCVYSQWFELNAQ